MQTNNSDCLSLEVGHVLEICFERYGDIKPFVIDKIGDTSRDNEYPSIRNSKYIRVRPLSDTDQLKESTTREGHIVFRLDEQKGDSV